MCHSGGAHPHVREAPPPPRPAPPGRSPSRPLEGGPAHAPRRQVRVSTPHPGPRQGGCPEASVYPPEEGECPQALGHPPPDPPPGATRPTAGPQDGPHLTSPILPRMLVAKNVSACSYGSHRFIRSLEHVQVQLSLSYSRRGDLEISLTSPMGTRSTLVAIRPLDISGQGYNNWIFMSTHYWDENPQGLWTLGLENKGYYFNTGTLFYYTLLLYGTGEDMTARPQGPQVTSQESHVPRAVLARLCLLSSRQWWWLQSLREQPVTEGQPSCHPPITPAGAA